MLDPSPEHWSPSLFRWQTLKEVTTRILPYKSRVAGMVLEVELATGAVVQVFRADDRQFYFCHGLTFGGKDAPGGPVSPFSGPDVTTILGELFQQVVPETNAVEGDILVWYDSDGWPTHSAILLQLEFHPNVGRLDFTTKVQSKNGKQPESTVTLEHLVESRDGYGESYRVHRRK